MVTVGLSSAQELHIIGIFSYGVATNDGGIAQAMNAAYSKHDVATSEVKSYTSASNAIGQVYDSAVSWLAAITNFSATNEIEFTTTASSANDIVSYLCLGVGNTHVYVGVDNSPTTTGTWGPNPGWTAQSINVLATRNLAIDGFVTSITNTFFQAASDSENLTGACVGSVVRDSTVTSPTWSSQATKLLHYDFQGAELVDADADTRAPNSWLDVTTENITTAQKWLCWAIEE